MDRYHEAQQAIHQVGGGVSANLLYFLYFEGD
jgi:hypothetical protein